MNIGHNNPPSKIDFCRETQRDLQKWLTETPVINTPELATEAKTWLDRTKGVLGDLEDERDSKVRPLNEQVKAINSEYKQPSFELTVTNNVLKERLGDYVEQEEARRIQAAEEAKKTVEATEAAARRAEEEERRAIEDAKLGVVTDAAAATIRANEAFSEYEKATREEARTQNATHVKIVGGFGRAASLRSAVTYIVQDPHAAIQDIGWTEALYEVIAKEARLFHKTHNRLPKGVSTHIERKI